MGIAGAGGGNGMSSCLLCAVEVSVFHHELLFETTAAVAELGKKQIDWPLEMHGIPRSLIFCVRDVSCGSGTVNVCGGASQYRLVTISLGRARSNTACSCVFSQCNKSTGGNH